RNRPRPPRRPAPPDAAGRSPPPYPGLRGPPAPWRLASVPDATAAHAVRPTRTAAADRNRGPRGSRHRRPHGGPRSLPRRREPARYHRAAAIPARRGPRYSETDPLRATVSGRGT